MDIYKAPRLYSDKVLKLQEEILLEGAQVHYLRSVMRRSEGDVLRLFDGVSGEFQGRIVALSKKSVSVVLEAPLRAQPADGRRIHLYFTPLAKGRMDFVIEKCTELGVTDFHPILTNRTDNRKVNMERVRAQVIEAAEQCERLDVPVLHDVQGFSDALTAADTPVYWCCERDFAERQSLSELNLEGSVSFLVGPAGGFDEREIEFAQRIESVIPVSLGERVLRSETASIVCLTAALLKV